MSPGYNGGCQRLGRRILDLRICGGVWPIAGASSSRYTLDSSGWRGRLLVLVPAVLRRWDRHHERHAVNRGLVGRQQSYSDIFRAAQIIREGTVRDLQPASRRQGGRASHQAEQRSGM